MSLATPLVESLKFTDFVVQVATGDVTDEISRRRARGDAGPSIAWDLGHLLHYRAQMAALLGQPVEDRYAERFGKAGATDGAGYPGMAELRRAWSEMSAVVLPLVERATDADLRAVQPATAGPHGEKTVLDTLVFLVWHEAYHMGQLSTIRTQLGLPPTADLVTAAASAGA